MRISSYSFSSLRLEYDDEEEEEEDDDDDDDDDSQSTITGLEFYVLPYQGTEEEDENEVEDRDRDRDRDRRDEDRRAFWKGFRVLQARRKSSLYYKLFPERLSTSMAKYCRRYSRPFRSYAHFVCHQRYADHDDDDEDNDDYL